MKFVIFKVRSQVETEVLGWVDAFDYRDACDSAEFVVDGEFIVMAKRWEESTDAERTEAERLGQQKGRYD